MLKERNLSASAVILQGTVVVLSDDATFQSEMHRSIASAGFICRYADGLNQAQVMLTIAEPDVVVVDGGISGRNGAQVCQSLRSLVDCPLLVIDHSGETIDRILALELGADDCLTHPVDGREILARVRALVRRHNRSEVSQVRTGPIGAGWRLRLTTRQLFGPDSSGAVTLTTSEQELFVMLVKQAGQPVVLPAAAGVDGGCVPIGQLRTTVSRLRQKLLSAGFDRLVIRSVYTQGYVFDRDTANAGVISA